MRSVIIRVSEGLFTHPNLTAESLWLMAGFEMDAFGNRIPGSTGWPAIDCAGLKEHLTGKMYDEDTGLYYFHARCMTRKWEGLCQGIRSRVGMPMRLQETIRISTLIRPAKRAPEATSFTCQIRIHQWTPPGGRLPVTANLSIGGFLVAADSHGLKFTQRQEKLQVPNFWIG